jgi:hypothetical protein
MGLFDSQFDGAPLPVLDLGVEESFQIMKMGVVVLTGFFGQR